MRTDRHASARPSTTRVWLAPALGLLAAGAVGLAPSGAAAFEPGVKAEPAASEPAASEPAASEPAARGPARWRQVPADDPRRFSIVGHFETQVVGLAFGVRADALYRPFRPDRGANLCLGLGLQGGPELAYLPLALGWRQHFVPHRILTLELGAGYEQQTFFVPGLRPISRPAFYAEGGFAFRVIPGGWLGAQLVPSYAPLSRPGPGLAVRVGFRWTIGGGPKARARRGPAAMGIGEGLALSRRAPRPAR